MKISVIILNYKSQGHLRQCLRGLRDYGGQSELEVIVIDNASHDDSASVVKREYPSAAFHGLNENRGYAVGNNVGLKQSTGDLLMILNPDVAIFNGAIDRLADYLHRHQQVGLVAPKLINPNGTVQMSGAMLPSFWMPLWRRSSLGHWPGPRQRIEKYFYRGWDRTTNRPIGWALGACFMFKRSAWQSVGDLDERFFMYFEDVDFCRRFWAAGWEVHYLAEAEMMHYLSRDSAVTPGLSGLFSYATRIHINSWLKYAWKYRGQQKLPQQM